MIYPNLKAELAKRGWTLKMLAEMVNMSIWTLTAKLNGKSALRFSEAKEIKRALGTNISLEELFAKKGEVA
jgi:DNA-binding Xre family transcriptional regulator